MHDHLCCQLICQEQQGCLRLLSNLPCSSSRRCAASALKVLSRVCFSSACSCLWDASSLCMAATGEYHHPIETLTSSQSHSSPEDSSLQPIGDGHFIVIFDTGIPSPFGGYLSHWDITNELSISMKDLNITSQKVAFRQPWSEAKANVRIRSTYLYQRRSIPY